MSPKKSLESAFQARPETKNSSPLWNTPLVANSFRGRDVVDESAFSAKSDASNHCYVHHRLREGITHGHPTTYTTIYYNSLLLYDVCVCVCLWDPRICSIGSLKLLSVLVWRSKKRPSITATLLPNQLTNQLTTLTIHSRNRSRRRTKKLKVTNAALRIFLSRS